MKRPLVTAIFLCAGTLLVGCPIYEHEDAGCYRSSDCGPGYLCNTATNDCVVDDSRTTNSCSKPSDCAVNATCGKDAQCASGDCFFHGCVSGYVCDKQSGAWACVADTGGAAGAGGAGASESSGGGQSAGGASAAGAGGLSSSAGAAGQAGGS